MGEKDLKSAMDTKVRSLQLLGTFRIVGEAFKIIHSQAKLMGTITLVMILPCVLIIWLNIFMVPFLFPTFLFVEYPVELIEIMVLELGWVGFFYATLMPSIASVVYTVAGFYKGEQENSIASVMKPVPAVWKRMLTTWLQYFILNFLFIMVFALVPKLALIVPHGYNFVLAIGLMVFGYVVMYVTMWWQIATMVSVMEDYYGSEGMKRSRCLIHGKRTTAWALTITCMVIVGLFNYAAVLLSYSFVGLGVKILSGIAYVVLACVIILMWEVTQTVLYFVCKSHHEESVAERCCFEGCPEKTNNNNGGLKLEPSKEQQ